MLEFMNRKGEIVQAHEITDNYNNPNFEELLLLGWKPLYYEIPTFNKDTHFIKDYKIIVGSKEVIAKAIIEEVYSYEDDVEV